MLLRNSATQLFGAALVCAFASSAVLAADNDESPVRFLSLKRGEVFLREGPSDKNRVKFVYHHKGMPLEVLAEYDVWRRVRDMDGDVGWVHVAMLSQQRTVLIVGEGNAPVYDGDESGAAIKAYAAPGAIGRVEHCGSIVCEIAFDGRIDGYVARTRLWGVTADETF